MRKILGSLALISTCVFSMFAVGCTVTTDPPTTPSPAPTGNPDPNKPGDGLGFKASNIPAPDFTKTGDVVVSDRCTIDSDKGTIDCVEKDASGALPFKYSKVKQADSSEIGVFVFRSLTINASTEVELSGSIPVVLVAQKTINIQGSIAGAEIETNGGGFVTTSAGKGGGPGGGAGSHDYNAAGGGSYCGLGGKGFGEASLAEPGKVYGSESISPLIGGSAGGADKDDKRGGPGGGALQLVAGESVVVTAAGIVNMGGRGGYSNGSAGGSGGAILIESVSVTVSGTLAVNGGGGNVFVGGGAAQSGQPSTTRASGLSETAGKGSAGADLAGTDGSAGKVVNDHGGGGGGAGRIRIHTKDGKATIASSSTLSPTLGTACATQGKLAL